VRAGEVVAELHADEPERLAAGRAAMEDAVRVGPGPARATRRVIGRIAAGAEDV
jgi:hypothetical protein